ncbi:MAG TPA: 4-hydroxy-3-methylbut-2-enyl diphosphate reductase, partial [bacterium]|nr:4-hydroxy-3-methylbut-2-enyl diphosphate reductase [bacterium]
MEIIKGKSVGFCSGVRRAVRGAEKLLDSSRGIYCLGEIIHNPNVVESLRKKGMKVVPDLSQVPPGALLIIRSHGIPRPLVVRARRKKLKLHDFTCPRVKKIHELVLKIKKRYPLVIVGNGSHPEVQAIRSLGSEKTWVVEKKEEIASLPDMEKVAVVVQTTFDPSAFLEIVSVMPVRFKEVLVHNTLCEETILRQKEARALAEVSDLVIIVGGLNSSNTRMLYRTASAVTRSVQIERAEELEKRLFKDAGKIAIISGASTPEEAVNKIIRKVKLFYS